MKLSLDTNVLIAAFVGEHPHHVPAFDLVRTVKDGALSGCISTHGLAEFYSVITRAPFNPRVHPSEALRFLDDNVLPYFEVVSLTTGDYKVLLRASADAGLIGGVVFDALHLHCAEKSGCDRIYTFNLKVFRAVASQGMMGRIASP